MAREMYRTSRFRLRDMCYACALICVSLGLFGYLGIVVAVVGLPFLRTIINADRPEYGPIGVLEHLVILAIVLMAVLILYPVVAANRTHHCDCDEKLSAIHLALHRYHEIHKSYPPVCVAAEDGTRLHSWRVLILPELGRGDLYDRYRFDEPWNGPNNRKLYEDIPYAFTPCQVRGKPEGVTTYRAVVGHAAAWSPSRSRRVSEFTDDNRTTIWIVEREDEPILWTAPIDSIEQEAAELLTRVPEYPTSHHWKTGFFWSTWRGKFVRTDRAWVFGVAPNRDMALQMLRISDGKPQLPIADLRTKWTHCTRVIHWGNWFRVASFTVVVFWPIVALLYRGRHRSRANGKSGGLRQGQVLCSVFGSFGRRD
jgi:hypothetical protein